MAPHLRHITASHVWQLVQLVHLLLPNMAPTIPPPYYGSSSNSFISSSPMLLETSDADNLIGLTDGELDVRERERWTSLHLPPAQV